MTNLDKLNFKNNVTLKNDKEKVAYEMAEIAHAFQKRKSGEDYFKAHPLEVSNIILEKWKEDNEFDKINSDFGKNTMLVAYIHDIVEDTIVSLDNIKEIFGDDIFKIVNSVTENNELKEQLKLKVESGEKDKNWLKMEMLKDSLKKIEDLKKNENEDSWKIAAIVRVADIIQNLNDYGMQSESLKKRNLKKADIIYQEFKNGVNLAQELKNRINEIEDDLGEVA